MLGESKLALFLQKRFGVSCSASFRFVCMLDEFIKRDCASNFEQSFPHDVSYVIEFVDLARVYAYNNIYHICNKDLRGETIVRS